MAVGLPALLACPVAVAEGNDSVKWF